MTVLNPAKKFFYRELKNFLNNNLKEIGIDVLRENFKMQFFLLKNILE